MSAHVPDIRGRAMQRIRSARWRANHPGSQTAYQAAVRRTEAGRLRVNARNRLRAAVARGEIVKLPCEICHDPNSHAHHPWGYEGALARAVWWLCQFHHSGVHLFAA